MDFGMSGSVGDRVGGKRRRIVFVRWITWIE
jgi:hypothetical protein